VVCIRKDSPFAHKVALVLGDLQEDLRIFYHPQKHPDAHDRLLEMLSSAGVQIREYSRASHPSEMQALVREGFGVALVREGMALDEQLTSRPLTGIDWTIDTALIYHKRRHPKTIPILVRQFKKQFGQQQRNSDSEPALAAINSTIKRPNASVSSVREEPVQLRLLG
jgi:DNA-binding transcriptional LysR family regulator